MPQWTTTYTGLVTAIGDYCEDASTQLATYIGGIINRAEERVLRDLDITYFDDALSTTLSSGNATVAKSASMIAIQSIRLTSGNTFVVRRSRDFVKMYGGSGLPLYYCDDDTDITLAPTPDSSYATEIKFLSRPTPLSSSNQTNWLTTNVATCLLYASLKEAEHFLVAPERLAEYEAAYAENLGPARALWRGDKGESYDSLGLTAQPERTR